MDEINRVNTKQFTFNFTLEYNAINEEGSILLKFPINSQNDLNYLMQLQYLINFTKCIGDTYFNQKAFRITKKFRKILFTLVNNRGGKSIFSTKFCTSLNVHEATIPNNRFVKVPIDIGYTSHFRDRDSITDIQGITLPISFLKFDIEYLLFLAKNKIF